MRLSFALENMIIFFKYIRVYCYMTVDSVTVVMRWKVALAKGIIVDWYEP